MEYLIDKIIVADTATYLIDIDSVAQIPEEYFAEDFPKRLADSEKFVFREDALRSLGIAVLLKEVLGLTERDVSIGEFGKPYSDVIPENFSLSHSGDYAVLAVSNRNVGVDIEQIDSRHCSVATIVYTDEEIDWFSKESVIAHCDEGCDESRDESRYEGGKDRSEDRFMRIWTLKECVSKITGKGLNTDYKSFTVMPLINEGGLEHECHSITGDSVYYPDGYCLSVCVVQAD